MPDAISAAGRSPSDTERTVFQQLGLTAGHWAGLVAAPFYHRPGLRPPDLRQRGDLRFLEILRRELRTAPGLSDEAVRLWNRLGASKPAAELATRLLTWHLATDQPFNRRERFLDLLATAARQLETGARPRATETLVEDLRLLMDCYLPLRSFAPDAAPRWVSVPPPPADVLDAIARTSTALPCVWPAAPTAPMPAVVRLLGDPAGWWGKPHPGRLAAERGVAVFSFAERERLYADATAEWRRATASREPHGGRELVDGIREWVEGVRKSARLTAPVEVPKPLALAARPERVALPAAGAPRSPVGRWRCGACRADNAAGRSECGACGRPCPAAMIELTATATEKTLLLESGMRVGRAEYRDVFELPDAGLAAADQFEVESDPAGRVWRVRAVSGSHHPTCYRGEAIGPEGCELADGGVLSVGGKLELAVRLV